MTRYTHLQNEETLVIQVDTSALEKCSDLAESAVTIIDGVLAGVVPMRSPRHHKLRSWYDFVGI